MTWQIVAELIIELGLPATLKLIEKWSNGNPVTPVELQEVRAVAMQSAQDRMRAQLVKAGVDLDSDTAKALLGLAQ